MATSSNLNHLKIGGKTQKLGCLRKSGLRVKDALTLGVI